MPSHNNKTDKFNTFVTSTAKSYPRSAMARSKSSEDDDDEAEDTEFLSYATTNHVLTCLTVYLDEGIRSARYYRALVEHMANLTENDMVVIKINNHGGQLEGAITLMNAMRDTAAQVEVIIDGACISAASLIALAAPVVSVSPHSHMMLHSGSFGTAGKQENVEAHVGFLSPKVKKLMQEVYQDFVTDEEFSNIFKGVEMWMDTDEIHRRLHLRNEIREKRAEKQAQGPNKAEKAEKPKQSKTLK